ncbi:MULTISPECIES: outer membrane protein assembly factor BamD [unclassified Bartonella]|uniref:outer membrane protein assembly factor BamD n=1 Tax=unclassified Bartonella TaxID=2645622 RepID=UPI00099A5283|nr:MULTISPECIES: outer membrane protein assembly factor BamD [unclassified Bartonella]AQX28242.1 Beta-barrel assembly machine subunit BamD [Bartonella sp. JB15]AQX29513.1 Beta-barrel assembly machine subunit BamD [Bartonella sp. JB63]
MNKPNTYIGNIAHRKLTIIRKVLIGIFLGGTCCLAGCLGKGKNILDSSVHVLKIDPPDVLYNQALANLDAGRLSEAAKKFAIIEKQYAYTEWGRKALVMGAFTNYRLAKYDDAISMAQHYVSLYPLADDSAYAYYIIGLSSFRRIPDVTRDQRDTKRAIAAMQLLIERYPQSEYVSDAKAKIRFGREQLAGKEMQIGRYYEEGRQYLAAGRRFRTVIEEYPDTNQIEEALFRLTEVNFALGLTMEAQTAAAILGRNYPESKWYKFSYDLLQKNSILPQEHKSSWISRVLSGYKSKVN